MNDSLMLDSSQLITKLNIDEIESIPASIKKKLTFAHPYKIISADARDQVILSVIDSLNKHKFRVSGENDNTVWENGWGEVLASVKNNAKFSMHSLIPQYFKKELIYRLFGEYVYADSPNFVYDIDQIIRTLIFNKYLLKHKRIVEIGSGTGNSLYLLAQMCPATTELIGADWSTKSLELISIISKNVKRPLNAVLFNMLTLEGYDNLNINEETVVFTVHTLEQLGNCYKPLLEKLLTSKPALCVHAEPIKELYDPHNLMDYLAIKYHEIRNYLEGWLTALRELEKQKKVEIIEQKRIQFGNKFHEAYNLIVWRPL